MIYIKKKKPQSGMSRRQILSMLGLGAVAYPVADPLDILTRGIVDGLIRQAQAQSSIEPRNFVSILYSGAPPQWVWNFLRPNGDADSFIGNFSLKNSLTEDFYSGDSSKTQYRVVPVALPNGQIIHLPPLWQCQIPLSGGGSRPMIDLATNMMMFRGCNMQIDAGHFLGQALVVRPDRNGPSLTGLVADSSSKLLPALGLSPNGGGGVAAPRRRTYKSKTGTGIILLEDPNDGLNQILSPFRNTDPVVTQAYIDKLNEAGPNGMKQKMKKAMEELADYARSRKPGSDALFQMRSKAESLFQQSFGNLTEEYTGLLLKYENLAKRCAEPVPFIIPSGGISPYNLTKSGASGLAGQFAIAEFMLKQGLSSSITMTGTAPRVNGFAPRNDEHYSANPLLHTDRQKSVIGFSYQFRVLAAMLEEFRRSLGPALWQETVVMVGAEYDRSPNNDRSGSDHAPGSNTLSIFSGAINQPFFKGNIKVNGSPNPRYPGTWGNGAPVNTNFAQGIRITNDHVASTVAQLLRVESPTRAPSLININNNGVITSHLGDPENVG